MLECIGVGEPNNTYQWQVNGTNLDNETLSILRLPNITADSGGEYTCVVSNYVDSTFLFVYPYFLSHPGDVQVTLGSMILLTCDAVGFPNPDYLWTRADGRIIRSDVRDGRDLNITDVLFGDRGEYSCHASGSGMSLQSQGSIVSGIVMIQLHNHMQFTILTLAIASLKGVQYSLIIHEVLVAVGLFSCSGRLKSLFDSY
jgi:hypothetical protein